MNNQQWGYSTPESEGSPAIWGARAIWPDRHGDPNFPLDLLPDRQSMRGEKADRDGLAYILNNGVLEAVQARMAAYEGAGLVRSDTRNEVVLYDSSTVKVIGNSNASHGYFYVTAFIKVVDLDKHVPDTEGDLAEFEKHAIESKHLFLVIEGGEPSREDLKRERRVLDALRGEEIPRHPEDSPENRVQQDPTDCLWLPHGPSTMVMGREWKEVPFSNPKEQTK